MLIFGLVSIKFAVYMVVVCLLACTIGEIIVAMVLRRYR